eukprot:6217842-Prymnesium_polylepis.1
MCRVATLLLLLPLTAEALQASALTRLSSPRPAARPGVAFRPPPAMVDHGTLWSTASGRAS